MSSTPTRRTPWLVPALIVGLAAVLVSVSVVLSGREDAADPAASPAPVADVVTPETAPTVDLTRLEADDPLAAGPVDAPVSLIVYSDYQCPFCASWAADTAPAMLDYAAAGDLRIEFRDIAVFGEDSRTAALAAYAAGLQGRYLDFHDALFPEGVALPPRGLTDEALVATADELGLDVERFTADMRSEEVADAVQRNIDEAATIGAFSTPAFLLAGQPILGAQPTDVFVTAVEQALSEAGA
ncbi:Protein-disulfide isomerase [Georgenia satyanarayanai]|uniref:Protein-disulfide isomerase n=1 Tax=Georgenia satyanarayanai TaxID=860221 RepID=A0A2Y8ZVS0_9MICO|nr:thioredoxin domain-containing protein [Georgenia satyanarayanai]PYG01611.1 protein-disulfide isomerase [Georgenia satyanarayanai]SSA36411.1 Protein-disulfide isomerase [Georgenia satyanarayanai]